MWDVRCGIEERHKTMPLEVGGALRLRLEAEKRLRIEIDEVPVVRLQIPCLFFLTPET